jgi:hypothetical protein
VTAITADKRSSGRPGAPVLAINPADRGACDPALPGADAVRVVRAGCSDIVVMSDDDSTDVPLLVSAECVVSLLVARCRRKVHSLRESLDGFTTLHPAGISSVLGNASASASQIGHGVVVILLPPAPLLALG